MARTVSTKSKSSEAWVADLRDAGPAQDRALEELSDYLRRGLYGFLREQRSDMARRDAQDLSQIAQDFAQEALLKLLDALDSYRGESHFLTWAMKIAVRTAMSSLRRAAYRDLSLDDLEARGVTPRLPPDASVRPSASPDPEREVERREVFAALERAIASELSERQRTAFLATNVDGVPVEIVAELLDSNPNALYKLVHDARKKLRDALVKQGYTFDRVAPMFEESQR